MKRREEPAPKPLPTPAVAKSKNPRAWLIAASLLLVAIGSGAYAVWRSVRPQVLALPQYVITAENVTVTPPPKWIRSDVKSEVVRDLNQAGPLSVLDEDLGERFYEAFAAHPWVAKVERVLKRPPAGVEVTLVYRRPVLMVQVTGGLLPLDAEGVQLPTADFSPLEARRYPRLSEFGAAMPPPAGTRWTDARVVAAAALAALLIDSWDELGLHHLAVASDPSASAGQIEFDLFTQAGTRIAWGAAPTAKPEGQAAATDKLSRLRRYHAEHNTLEGSRGPQVLDLRTPHGVEASPRTARRPNK
ncbi:MAG TPA: hypothetical protein VNH11_26305 [Pirellulales bacterium]|nr:hypothetical protein [Pirellulales bacterium]